MSCRTVVLTLSLVVTGLLSSAAEDAALPSYQAAVEKRRAGRAKGGGMSDEVKAIMTKAAADLDAALPNPGLAVGAKAPDFELPNAKGKNVSLADHLKKGPVVLTFYRGAWCSYCSLELSTLQDSLPAFAKYDASLIAVTPQRPDHSQKQLEADEFSFEILSDLDDSVAKAYNLYFAVAPELHKLYSEQFKIDITAYNGEGRLGLPVPGTFVIARDGVVRAAFADTDYKKRMEPSDIVAALKAIEAEE